MSCLIPLKSPYKCELCGEIFTSRISRKYKEYSMPVEISDGNKIADTFRISFSDRKSISDRKYFSGMTGTLKKQHGSTQGFLQHSDQGGI